MYKINDLYDLSHSQAKDYLSKYQYPWQALKEIKDFIIELGETLGDEYQEVNEHVWIHKDAKVFDSAYIGSPCIIGAGTEVRHCAFIRGSSLVGENCVIGNSVELKNVIIKSHMGAGSITSNVKSDKTLVVVKDRINHEEIETGLKKVGAMLGDYVEVGCNSVLNPGTVIGRNSNIYPLSRVRGVVPTHSIFKDIDHIVEKNTSII